MTISELTELERQYPVPGRRSDDTITDLVAVLLDAPEPTTSIGSDVVLFYGTRADATGEWVAVAFDRVPDGVDALKAVCCMPGKQHRVEVETQHIVGRPGDNVADMLAKWRSS
jgi:hypothetical protein